MPPKFQTSDEAPCAHCGGCTQPCGAQNILPSPDVQTPTRLRQWPVKLHQIDPRADFFHNAHLLVAADCAVCACGDFHQRFLHNRAALIGCARTDTALLAETLSSVLHLHNIRTVTILGMDSPCCTAFLETARQSVQNCGKFVPWQLLYLSADGQVSDKK